MTERKPQNKINDSKTRAHLEKSDIGMLQYCLHVLYQHDSDELAWRLVERFGSVAGIFNATFEELMLIDGMTERVATFFVTLRPIQRQAILRASSEIYINCERTLAEYAAVFFMNEYNAYDVCVCLDRKNKIICAERLKDEERLREIAATVCKRNAQKLAIIRLDPRLAQKSVLPSPERQRLLLKILKLLAPLKVEFVDYMEYHNFVFFSLRRAVRGDMGVYHVNDSAIKTYDKIENFRDIAKSYYENTVAHAIEQELK